MRCNATSWNMNLYRSLPSFPAAHWESAWVGGSHLQLVLLLLGDFGEQLGFLSRQRLDQRVTLSHEAGFKLHSVLLKETHIMLVAFSSVQFIFLWDVSEWSEVKIGSVGEDVFTHQLRDAFCLSLKCKFIVLAAQTWTHGGDYSSVDTNIITSSEAALWSEPSPTSQYAAQEEKISSVSCSSAFELR